MAKGLLSLQDLTAVNFHFHILGDVDNYIRLPETTLLLFSADLCVTPCVLAGRIASWAVKCIQLSSPWQKPVHHLPLCSGSRWFNHTCFPGGDLSFQSLYIAIVENMKTHLCSTMDKTSKIVLFGAGRKWNIVKKTKYESKAEELRSRKKGLTSLC